jgi:hypothetical protein
MHSKRLGLGILVVLASVLAGCDKPLAPDTSSANHAVAALQPSFARGGNGAGKPGSTSTAPRITMTPSSLALTAGSGGWLHVTLYDRSGRALPDDDSSLVWFGCRLANVSDFANCVDYLSVEPVYPNLRDVYVRALAAGTFTVWADDGTGNTASATVTVQ